MSYPDTHRILIPPHGPATLIPVLDVLPRYVSHPHSSTWSCYLDSCLSDQCLHLACFGIQASTFDSLSSLISNPTETWNWLSPSSHLAVQSISTSLCQYYPSPSSCHHPPAASKQQPPTWSLASQEAPPVHSQSFQNTNWIVSFYCLNVSTSVLE